MWIKIKSHCMFRLFRMIQMIKLIECVEWWDCFLYPNLVKSHNQIDNFIYLIQIYLFFFEIDWIIELQWINEFWDHQKNQKMFYIIGFLIFPKFYIFSS